MMIKMHGNTRHGMTGTRTHDIWRRMLQRCVTEIGMTYINYGMRGISVCKRWETFENFLEDMGECPEGMSIDRINNSGDYTPENCKWSTSKEQARNRDNSIFITYDGITCTLAEWAEKLGIKYLTLYTRIFVYKWTIKRAFTQRVSLR